MKPEVEEKIATDFLHVIAFEAPYPPVYGGVMEVFYKIKSLKKLGVKVILHCFLYGNNKPAAALNEICYKIYYYERPVNLLLQFSLLPFIVISRKSKALLNNLLQDDFPILMEGLHCCGWISDSRLENRKKIVRIHNVEWEYYKALGSIAGNFLKRFYFNLESWKLFQFEKRVARVADIILTLSLNDQKYYQSEKTHFIPVFHPSDQVSGKPGRGDFVLFHGKLSVPDNEEAVLFLIKNVFSSIKIPFVIAGMQPGERIRKAILPYPHIRLIADPDEEAMDLLIGNAQIQLLWTFQVSGVKLKLLQALYKGRFVIVNKEMVSGTGLETLVLIADAGTVIRYIEDCFQKEWPEEELKKRRDLLLQGYDNTENARLLMKIIHNFVPK